MARGMNLYEQAQNLRAAIEKNRAREDELRERLHRLEIKWLETALREIAAEDPTSEQGLMARAALVDGEGAKSGV